MSTLRTPERRAQEKRAQAQVEYRLSMMEARVQLMEADVRHLQDLFVNSTREKEKLFDMKLKKVGIEAKIEARVEVAKLEALMNDRLGFFRRHLKEMHQLHREYEAPVVHEDFKLEPIAPWQPLIVEFEVQKRLTAHQEQRVALFDARVGALEALLSKSPAAKSPAAKSPAAKSPASK